MKNRSITYYKKLVEKIPKQTIKVTSLSEYINAIIALNNISVRWLYRGQTNKKWDIVSSAYRHFENPEVALLRDYHIKLLDGVTNLRDCTLYEGLEMIAHLQHNGAKTIFLDYTHNPLIALWFACNAKNDNEKSADACVYCISNNYTNYILPINGKTEINELFEKESDIIYRFLPPNINRRILAQQSVFLINITGKLDKSKHYSIVIASNDKQNILKELELFGVSQNKLFHDFQGFIEWFDYSSTENFYTLIAEAEERLGKANYSQAIAIFENALKLGISLFGEDGLEIASVYHSLGYAYDEQGEWDKALELYNNALTIYKHKLGNEHPSTTTTLNNIALIYDVMGDYDKALELHKFILQTEESILGKNHYDVAVSYNNLALVYYHKGYSEKESKYYDNALINYNKALEIYKKSLKSNHHNIITAYLNISTVYLETGNYNKSLEYSKKALGISDKEYPDTVKIYNNIASIYLKREEYKEALEMCEKALFISDQILQENHQYKAYVYFTMELIYSEQERYNDATQSFLKSYRIRYSKLGATHSETIEARKEMENSCKKIENNIPFEDWLKINL
jgi:tetratricopeptide (TPR) repeat protein